MRKIRDNLPLALMGMAFVALAAATQCTASSGDPATNDAVNNEADASQLGKDDSGTPMGCVKDTDCPLPPSKCDGPNSLVYYTDAKCVQHQCQWKSQRQAGGYCSTGGFLGTTTAGGEAFITMSDGQAGVATLADAAEDHPNIASPDAGTCADEDASSCAVPSSVCADDRWLAFFTTGTCQQNRCTWEVDYRDCGSGKCQSNGCVLNVTAK